MRKLVAALMLAATPFATAVAGDMSYTYVEAGWTEVKIDDDWLDDPKGDGAYIRGSYAIADQVYLFGGYAEVSKTYRLAPGRVKFELAQPEFGIGWHQEARHALGAAVLTGTRHHDQHIGAARAGDKALAAVQHIVIAVTLGTGAQVRGVGAGVRFGQAVGGQ